MSFTGLILLTSQLNVVCWGYWLGSSRRPPTAAIRRIHGTRTDSAVADELSGWNPANAHIFLEKYWQKKPAIIRQAFPNIDDDVKYLTEADFLNLSHDEDVESRILVRTGNKWRKDYGPFDPKFTSTLPKDDWTILVQEVDRHVPAIADLWKKYFDFIPSWRRDDVMISYAAPGGGIGAHVDSYDVFLIQGRGQREWAIENSFVSAEEELRREVPNVDTRLLKDFRADQVWMLNKGDMLYLPPRVPHRGVSLGGGCTTISMGFRSPAHRSLVTALCDFVCQNFIPEKLMYSDPGLALQKNSGLIGEDARQTFRNDITGHILSCLNDKEVFDYWLGKYITVPLRMQLRKPRPFFLESSSEGEDAGPRRSLRSIMKEKGLADSSIGRGIAASKGDNYDEFEEDYQFDDDDDGELPVSLRGAHRVASHRVFPNVQAVLESFLKGEISLRRAEGAKLAFTETIMFVDGEAYPLPGAGDSSFLGPLLCDDRMVTLEYMRRICPEGFDITENSSEAAKFIHAFIEAGYFYPVDT